MPTITPEWPEVFAVHCSPFGCLGKTSPLWKCQVTQQRGSLTVELREGQSTAQVMTWAETEVHLQLASEVVLLQTKIYCDLVRYTPLCSYVAHVSERDSHREQCKAKGGCESVCLSQLLVTELCQMPMVQSYCRHLNSSHDNADFQCLFIKHLLSKGCCTKCLLSLPKHIELAAFFSSWWHHGSCLWSETLE